MIQIPFDSYNSSNNSAGLSLTVKSKVKTSTCQEKYTNGSIILVYSVVKISMRHNSRMVQITLYDYKASNHYSAVVLLLLIKCTCTVHGLDREVSMPVRLVRLGFEIVGHDSYLVEVLSWRQVFVIYRFLLESVCVSWRASFRGGPCVLDRQDDDRPASYIWVVLVCPYCSDIHSDVRVLPEVWDCYASMPWRSKVIIDYIPYIHFQHRIKYYKFKTRKFMYIIWHLINK